MDDWTILFKNAIAVLVILLALSVVVFLTFLGLSAANKGSEDLSSSVDAIDARILEAYNGKELTGISVLAAIQQYQNRPLAIIVRTKSSGYVNYNAMLATKEDSETINPDGRTLSITDAQTLFIAASGSAADHTVGMVTTTLFVWENLQNINLVKATDSAYAEYINPGSKFRSVLIYDLAGEVLGLLIEQVGLGSDSIL